MITLLKTERQLHVVLKAGSNLIHFGSKAYQKVAA